MQVNSMHDLTAALRGRRRALGLSQAELAARARVSRQWISELEGGKPAAELGLVLRVLHALDLRLDLSEAAGGRDRPTRGAMDLDALLDEYRDS
jgi:HTH-type transcriptional regulator/antitoxin HipB